MLLTTSTLITEMLTLLTLREWCLSSLSAGPQKTQRLTLAPELSLGEGLLAASKKSGQGRQGGAWQLRFQVSCCPTLGAEPGHSLAHMAAAALETVGA